MKILHKYFKHGNSRITVVDQMYNKVLVVQCRIVLVVSVDFLCKVVPDKRTPETECSREEWIDQLYSLHWQRVWIKNQQGSDIY